MAPCPRPLALQEGRGKKQHADVKQKVYESETKLQQEQYKLKGLLQENRTKIEELEIKMETKKKTTEETKVSFRCEECGKVFLTKPKLKVHIKTYHPKNISCDHFELTF